MAQYKELSKGKAQALQDIANKLRIHVIEATNACNSGHLTSCCSIAEIMSVLFFETMRYSVKDPRHLNSDRFILSKGHAAPILYAAWAEAGLFPQSDLLNLRKITSDLEGHPTPRLNFVDVATGSLGMGLSFAAGMSYIGKYIDKADFRNYCVVGDGESAEGSIWEALNFGSFYKLDNLVAIFDINRLCTTGETNLGHNLEVYKARVEAFGWNTIVVDGHDVHALAKAFWDAAQVKDKPTCVLAKTYKGQGIPGVVDQELWHGKVMGAKGEEIIKMLRHNMFNAGPHNIVPKEPKLTLKLVDLSVQMSEAPDYRLGDMIPPRVAYGKAVTKLGKNNDRVIALDADLNTSTFSCIFKEAFPDRYIECFIAEQNLVGVAIGCATRNRAIPFISTFAAFLYRAFDVIRMGAISQTSVNFVGTHVGVSIGPDGPSQMALEDIAMFRTIPGSTIFYPSDAVSTERAVELAANTKGICFIRITRPELPVIYTNNEKFEIGEAKIIRQSPTDKVTVIGGGVTLMEAVKAADILASSGINICIVDPITIKPIDTATIVACAQRTGGKIITVEDHYPEGGIGDTVSSAVVSYPNILVKSLAVHQIPRSGKGAELLDKYGINATAIVKAVKSLLSSA